jgi:hypothetical protein
VEVKDEVHARTVQSTGAQVETPAPTRFWPGRVA